MNLLIKSLYKIWPKPKKRVEVIESKVQEICKDLLTASYSDYEIAMIITTTSKDLKSALEDRKRILTHRLEETTRAINKL